MSNKFFLFGGLFCSDKAKSPSPPRHIHQIEPEHMPAMATFAVWYYCIGEAIQWDRSDFIQCCR